MEFPLFYIVWDLHLHVLISVNLQGLNPKFQLQRKDSHSFYFLLIGSGLYNPPQVVLFLFMYFFLPQSASSFHSFGQMLIGTLTSILLGELFLHMYCTSLSCWTVELYQQKRHSLDSVFTKTVSECLVPESVTSTSSLPRYGNLFSLSAHPPSISLLIYCLT